MSVQLKNIQYTWSIMRLNHLLVTSKPLLQRLTEHSMPSNDIAIESKGTIDNKLQTM